MKIKWTAFLLAVLTVLSAAGCASSPAIMEYENKKITSNMYRYWLSTYKGTFMQTYTDMKDSDEFWNSLLYEDVTAEQYLNTAVTENVKRMLVCSTQFDKLGLKLTDAAVEDINAYIETLIAERADGSRNAFNQMLAQYGINIDMLREIYLMEDKTSMLFSRLYAKGGDRELSDEAMEAFCQEHYVRVRHIYVNDAYVYDTNEEGQIGYDESGMLKTRELTDAEKAEKAAKIAAIDKALADGTAFENVYETYSEDLYYKNGYYLSATTSFIPSVITAAFSLEVGEWKRVESDYGVHYILRMEMDEKPYENEENADFFASFDTDAQNDDFLNWTDELISQVEVDEEELQKYSIRDAVPNYSI